MKAAALLVLSGLFVVSAAAPARAQLGALGKIKKTADKAADAKGKYDDWNFTDEEEKQLGQVVSDKLRARFGVMQDQAVTKYVTLVGTVVAQASSRPALDWKFIVLDSDGVNAYAAPGGFVHITRGLLGLMKNEAELAGVLGHEVTHVADKHTIKAIQKGKELNLGADVAGSKMSSRADFLTNIGNKFYQKLFAGEWSRTDEEDADKVGIRDANKAGYAPNGLATALQKVADRNTNTQEPNGLFASHPVIKDRIASIEKQIAAEKLTAKAIAEARYKEHITFDAKAITEITTVDAGASGLASGEKKKDEKAEEKKDDSGKKKGFGLSSIKGGSQQAQSGQQTASAGARGGVPDRDAKGGTNPAIVAVKVTPEEITSFKKGLV
jgi:predicted Zn-dependent protease